MGQGHGAPDVRDPGTDRRPDPAIESTVLARKSSFHKSNDCKPKFGEVCPAAARNDNSASKSSRCGANRSRPAPNQAPAAIQRVIFASPSRDSRNPFDRAEGSEAGDAGSDSGRGQSDPQADLP